MSKNISHLTLKLDLIKAYRGNDLKSDRNNVFQPRFNSFYSKILGDILKQNIKFAFDDESEKVLMEFYSHSSIHHLAKIRKDITILYLYNTITEQLKQFDWKLKFDMEVFKSNVIESLSGQTNLIPKDIVIEVLSSNKT